MADGSSPAEDLHVPASADDLRVSAPDDPAGFHRGETLVFTFDGAPVTAYRGETIATALLAVGTRTLRRTRLAGRPRGLFCAIGACHDCLVLVDGDGPLRACMTLATDGSDVRGPHGS